MSKIIDKESATLGFGKYKGLSIATILRNDPSYILWLHEEGIVEFSDDIILSAEENDDREYDSSDMPENWGDLD